MNITIKQLKIFIGVAKSKSFTKTAQTQHISQSALSTAISELEKATKSRLFERTTRVVELTDSGAAFLTVATHIIETLENAALNLERLSREKQNVLKIGFTPFVAGSLAPKALKTFEIQNPQVAIEIIDKPPDELLRLVETGKIDAAYGAYFEKSLGIKKNLICPTHLSLVRGLDLSSDPQDLGPIRWSYLNHKTLICLPKDNPIQRLIEEQLVKHKITLEKRREVSQIETQIALAESNYGVALVPSLASSICERYHVSIQPIGPKLRIDFYCIQKSGLGFSPLTSKFSETMKKIMCT